MDKNNLASECIPILSSIFVKWKWMLTTAMIIFLAFGGVSYQFGKKIENQDTKIRGNETALERIDKNIIRLEHKIDTLIFLIREKGL